MRRSYKPNRDIERALRPLGPKRVRALRTQYEAIRDDDGESLLRLALLKQLASWRQFLDQCWPTVVEADRSNRELIAAHTNGAPDPANDPEGYWPQARENDKLLLAFIDRCEYKFGIQRHAIIERVYAKTEVGYFIHDRVNLNADALRLMDPATDEESFPDQARQYLLPRLFFQPAVQQLPPSADGGLWPLGWVRSLEHKPAPHDRILKVDLRKKRSQLIAEFAAFLDHEEAWHDGMIDRSRARKEAWRNLRIWRMRRQRKGFRVIARELKINVDSAKKGFYRAFKLIEGRTYDSEYFRRDYWLIRKSELKRTCSTCPDRDACTILCPDVLPFVDQDLMNSTREKLGPPIPVTRFTSGPGSRFRR